jgi:hypothetical protein
LVYLKAGYCTVFSKLNYATTQQVNVNELSFTNLITGGSQSTTYGGYILGLGYKQMITDGFYGFAEGNYMGYGTQTISRTIPWQGGGGSSTVTINPSISSYQFLVGVGYKF